MESPDRIKKGLVCCSEDGCKGCPYENDCDTADGFSVIAFDALAYIQQLERENKKLKSANIVLNAKAALTDEAIEAGAKAQKELEQVKRERDAAVSDLEMVYHEGICKVCANYGRDEAYNERRCLLAWDECRFEWRGVSDV